MKRSRIFYIVFVFLLFCACTKEEKKALTGLLKSEFELPFDGGEIRIDISASKMHSVQIADSVKSWISLSRTSAAESVFSYYFKIAPNDSYEERKASIGFRDSSSGETMTVTVTQEQNDGIVVYQNEYNFSPYSQSVEINLKANVDFKPEVSEEWLSVIKSKAMESYVLKLHLEDNPVPESREGVIRLVSETVEQEIRIIQLGKTDMINLSLTHREEFMSSPLWTGPLADGYVFWEEGIIERYSEDRTYEFPSYGSSVVTKFEMTGVDSFEIKALGSISSISISFN